MPPPAMAEPPPLRAMTKKRGELRHTRSGASIAAAAIARQTRGGVGFTPPRNASLCGGAPRGSQGYPVVTGIAVTSPLTMVAKLSLGLQLSVRRPALDVTVPETDS